MTIDKKVIIPASAVGTTALAMVPTLAFADEATVQSTVSTMAGTVATDGQAMITAIIPAVAPLIAAVMVAVLGIRLVKKFGKG